MKSHYQSVWRVFLVEKVWPVEKPTEKSISENFYKLTKGKTPMNISENTSIKSPRTPPVLEGAASDKRLVHANRLAAKSVLQQLGFLGISLGRGCICGSPTFSHTSTYNRSSSHV